MFQFAFAMGYAKAMRCDLQTNDWWGRRVFPAAAELPLIDRILKSTFCDSLFTRVGMPRLGYFLGAKDIDLFGYFQHQKFIDFYTRKQAKEWFKLSPKFEAYAPNKEHTGTYSAKHLRRGDYTVPPFNALYATVSNESYDRAVEQFNSQAPIIPVFEGCVPVDKYLMDLGVPWLSDWLTLRDADHLLRANSSFSWWAAALSNGKVYSPVVGKKVGLQHCEFVEGNHPNLAGVFPNQSDLFLKEE